MNDYFYGWYFRCQSEQGTIAVIPAVHVSGEEKSCSIQVITEEGAWNREYPIGQFQIDRRRLRMRIGEHVFSKQGLRLNLRDENLTLVGTLKFGAFTKLNYDIMGPFSHLPFMECKHEVFSMRHEVWGTLCINGRIFSFQGDMGYMEGDQGTSFPSQYIWTQHLWDEGSIVLAVAEIPWAGFRFTGNIGVVWWRGKEYRFATYLGATVSFGDRVLWIRQGKYQLRVRFIETYTRSLQAPHKGKMIRKIGENPSCHVEYLMIYKDQILFHLKTDRAAFEYEM